MSKNSLTGHTSPQTAYVVEDYPYGFRLRTTIRYWLETKPSHGQRFVSQTLNPRTGRWNKPKASTYAPVAVMFVNADGHVKWDGLSAYSEEEKIAEYERIHADALTGNYERETIRHLRAAHRAQKKMTWSIHTCKPGCTEHHQTFKEQSNIIKAATRRELWAETLDAIKEA